MTRRARLTLLLAAIVAVLFAGRWVAVVLTDRWWAQEISPDAAAFLTEQHLLELTLAGGAILVAAAWFIGHLLVVIRAVGAVQVPRNVANVEFRETLTSRVLLAGAVGLGLVLGTVVGGSAAAGWRTVVLAWHGVSYGLVDPLLGQDVGYYVAQLPLWRSLRTFALLLSLVAVVVVVTLYVVIGALRWIEGRPAINTHARRHLGWLLAAVAVVLAWGHVLTPYELVAGRSTVPLDMGTWRLGTVVSPVLTGVALAAAAISAVWAARPRHTLLAAGWLLLALATLVGRYVLPPLVRTPREPAVSAAAAQAFLRTGFGLDSIVPSAYAGTRPDSIPPAVGALWDEEALRAALPEPGDSLLGIQAAPAPFPVGGGLRPAWLAVVPVAGGGAQLYAVADDRTGASGQPLYYREADSTPAARAHPMLTLPAASSHQGAPRYVISADAPGPLVGAWPRRLLLGWRLQVGRLLGGVGASQRVAWDLSPEARLARLAPFAEWGEAVPRWDEGELWWLVPGYVGSGDFPLTPRVPWRGGVTAALRAGFLGLVRARDGRTTVYRRDGGDPLAEAWAEVAAGVVLDADRMPAGLREAAPYPVQLFAVQRAALERGGAEPLWPRGLDAAGASAGHTWAGDSGGVTLLAVYERPGAAGAGIAALLAGRVERGRDVLRLWRLDAGTTLAAPDRLEQIWSNFPLHAAIRDSVERNGGSVRAGPVRLAAGGTSLAAYQPLYAQRDDAPPAVVWMSVALGQRVGAGRSLTDAWRNLQGLSIATPPVVARPQEPLERARRLMQDADAALRRGDWAAFGRAWDGLRSALGVRPSAPGALPRDTASAPGRP